MLSEGEKKAIEKLKETSNQCHASKCWEEKFCSDCYIEVEDILAIDTVLNRITKLEKENEEVKRAINVVEKEKKQWIEENNQKDKQIDLIVEYIAKIDIEEDVCMKNKTNPDWCNEDYTKCKDCIKQYFERKAKDGRL